VNAKDKFIDRPLRRQYDPAAKEILLGIDGGGHGSEVKIFET